MKTILSFLICILSVNAIAQIQINESVTTVQGIEITQCYVMIYPTQYCDTCLNVVPLYFSSKSSFQAGKQSIEIEQSVGAIHLYTDTIDKMKYSKTHFRDTLLLKNPTWSHSNVIVE